jgi:hypothetical protein
LSRLVALLLALLGHVVAHADDCPPNAGMPTPAEMAALQAAATDHGVLWKIKRDGHVSWLYGSLHIGRLSWAVPGPALANAWRSTDVLALELDLSDPKTMAALLEEGKPGPEALPPALAQRLAAQAGAECVPLAALAAYHPLLQLSTLTALSVRRDGLDPSFGQEPILSGMAHASGRTIVALETAKDQMQALLPKDRKEMLEDLDDGLSQLEQNKVRGPMVKMAEAWAHGDLATLQNYEDWCDCVHSEADAQALHRLNDERNGPLAKRIAALHASGKRVLVAVGALHMTGANALPKLLAAQGFEVERINTQP